MARLFRFFRCEAGKESLKILLRLHPPSIQARIMVQKSRLFAGDGSVVRI